MDNDAYRAMIVDPVAPGAVVQLDTAYVVPLDARVGSTWRIFGELVQVQSVSCFVVLLLICIIHQCPLLLALLRRSGCVQCLLPMLRVLLLRQEEIDDYGIFMETVRLRRTLLDQQGLGTMWDRVAHNARGLTIPAPHDTRARHEARPPLGNAHKRSRVDSSSSESSCDSIATESTPQV